jgi:Predicted dehydrogenases and related proteins
MSSEKPRVKIGFVGVGGMGQAAHLRNYVLVPECEVVAIAEIRQELAKSVAARWGVPRVYASHEEMLEKEELDGIVAPQPFLRHGTLVPELLSKGVPILTEKPLAGSIEMGEKILAAMQAAKTWMMIAYHKRSDPASMAAKKEIDRLRATNELGKINYVRTIIPRGEWTYNGFSQNLGSSEPYPQLSFDPPASDMDKATFDAYTSFTDYYVHQINFVGYLLGEKWSPAYVAKSGRQLSGVSAGGVDCSLEMAPYSSTLEWGEEAFVCFERGWVRISLPGPLAMNRAGRLEVFRDPGNGATPKKEEWQMPSVGAMWQQARNFVAALRGDRDVACCGVPEALDDLRFTREFIRLWKGA